jgi:hypothetical protein
VSHRPGELITGWRAHALTALWWLNRIDWHLTPQETTMPQRPRPNPKPSNPRPRPSTQTPKPHTPRRPR